MLGKGGSLFVFYGFVLVDTTELYRGYDFFMYFGCLLVILSSQPAS